MLEAEEADRTAMGEVFALCFAGHALEDALSHVAVDRDILRHLVCERPKGPKVEKGKLRQSGEDKEPLKRRKSTPVLKDQKDQKHKSCHSFRLTGKCKFGDTCKFQHEAAAE